MSTKIFIYYFTPSDRLQTLASDLLVLVSDEEEDGRVRGAQLPVECFETSTMFAGAIG